MANMYKISFWICTLLLIGTNLFWLYQITDNAVSQSYSEISCKEYKQDTNELVKILKLKRSKSEMVSFLKSNNVNFTSFNKGDEYIVQLSSFDFTYGEDGELKETNQN